MRPLSPEQLLIIADDFCTVARTRVRSFSALCAAAAVPGARVHAVPVFSSASSAADALARTLVLVRPLVAHNEEFAEVAKRVYVDWANGAP